MTAQELKCFVWYQDQFVEQAHRATKAEIKCKELEKQIEFLKTYIKFLEKRVYDKKEDSQ